MDKRQFVKWWISGAAQQQSCLQPETEALIAAFTTPSIDGLTAAIDTLILGLKMPGYWDRIDCFEKYNMIAVDQTPFNWKTATSIMTVSGADMAFVTKTGFKGMGDHTGYIMTGFIPSNGVQYTLDACSWIIGRYFSSGDSFAEGVIDASNNRLILRGDGAILSVNGSANPGVTIGQIPVGKNMFIRINSTTVRSWIGSWIERTIARVGRANMEVYLNAYNFSGTVTSIGINGYNGVLFGDKFSDAEAEAIKTLLISFDTAVTAL